MKQLSIGIVLALCITLRLAQAQAVRVDPTPVFTTAGNVAPGAYAPVLAIPNSNVHICNSPANATPCTNYATTYTDATMATACPTSAQLVLAGTSTCVPNTDLQGNYGFWVAPGPTYAYTVTTPSGVNYGPYALTPIVNSAAGAISYTSLLSGAVPRTLPSKLGDANSVLDFGATCNNATIHTALATGLPIFIPGGVTCNYSTTLYPATGQDIYGPGSLVFTPTGSPTVSNMNASGTPTVYGANAFAINLRDVSGVTLSGFSLTTNSGYGIAFSVSATGGAKSCLYNLVQGVSVAGPGRGAASTSNNFVAFYFAGNDVDTGVHPIYFNTLRDVSASGVNASVLVDAPQGLNYNGANANIISNIQHYSVFRGVVINSTENIVTDGTYDQSPGSSASDLTIGVTVRNGAYYNRIAASPGEPGPNAEVYYTDPTSFGNFFTAGLQSNWSNGASDNGTLNDTNESRARVFSSLTEQHYYKVAVDSANVANRGLARQVCYSSKNDATVSASSGCFNYLAITTTPGTTQVFVPAAPTLQIGGGGALVFAGMQADSTSIYAVFLATNNGSGTSVGNLTLFPETHSHLIGNSITDLGTSTPTLLTVPPAAGYSDPAGQPTFVGLTENHYYGVNIDATTGNYGGAARQFCYASGSTPTGASAAGCFSYVVTDTAGTVAGTVISAPSSSAGGGGSAKFYGLRNSGGIISAVFAVSNNGTATSAGSLKIVPLAASTLIGGIATDLGTSAPGLLAGLPYSVTLACTAGQHLSGITVASGVVTAVGACN